MFELGCVGNLVVGLEVFLEENVRSKACQAHTWDREAYPRDKPMWDNVVVRVSRA